MSTMTEETVQQLEAMCHSFYMGNLEQQKAAHGVLLQLVENPSAVPQLQTLLARSSQHSALLFAAGGLTKLFTNHWGQISDSQKTDTKTFALNFLYTRGPDLLTSNDAEASATLNSFVRLVVRIIKYFWLEDPQHQNVVSVVSQFLSASSTHWIIGLSIYADLTSDIQPTIGPHVHRFRRTSTSFRDSALPEIFKVAIDTLRQFQTGVLSTGDRSSEARLLLQVLHLCLNCLSFDFSGTIPDETAEDRSDMLMIPHSWTNIKSENLPQLFFDLYRKCWSDISQVHAEAAKLCLRCLVLVAAVRRSFFVTDADRAAHIATFLSGTSKILETGMGLDNSDCFHEFCRLVGKINAANQLSELRQQDEFQNWLERIFLFTLSSLENWKHMPNSTHYLLGLWSHLVNPVLFLPDRVPSSLAQYLYRILLQFIQSRLLIADAVAAGDLDIDDPLADEVLRFEQLEVISSLGRCWFGRVGSHLSQLFDETIVTIASIGTANETQMSRLIWIIYICGAYLAGLAAARQHSQQAGGTLHVFRRAAPSSGTSSLVDDEDDTTDDGVALVNSIFSELGSRVFRVMQQADQAAAPSEPLELSFLYFLEQFVKAAMSEHCRIVTCTRTSNWHSSLAVTIAESLGLKLPALEEDNGDSIDITRDEGSTPSEAIVDLVVGKILGNLRRCAHLPTTVRKSLLLFSALTNGTLLVFASDRIQKTFAWSKLILKNSTIQSVLEHHKISEFLEANSYNSNRTLYYSALSRLLLFEVSERPDGPKAFAAFIAPISNVIDSMWPPPPGSPDPLAALKVPNVRSTLAGLFRDLRGICSACRTVESFSLFFNWIVNRPKHPGASRIHLASAVMDVWWDQVEVAIAVLKFATEFVENKSARISFDHSSPSGILLFKEASAILLTYGRRILSAPLALMQDPYRYRYKGLGAAIEMFAHVLTGNYTNFGIFEIYQDTTLGDTVRLGLQMCFAIPESDVQGYLKPLKSIHYFFEVVCRRFMPMVIDLDPPLLARFIRLIEEGLCSFEGGIPLQSCSSAESIAKFIHRRVHDLPDSTRTSLTDDEDIGTQKTAALRFMQSEPDALRRLLRVMFQLVVSGQISSTWSMARPMLALIVLYLDEFVSIKEQLVAQVSSPVKREKLMRHFDELMDGIVAEDGADAFSSKNKDTFTRNLYAFAQAVRSGMN